MSKLVNKFSIFMLALFIISGAALMGCSPDDSKDGDVDKDAVVLKVSDYGAVGDGKTDDSSAISTVMDMAKMKGQNNTPVIIEFEKDKSYYFKDMYGASSIMYVNKYKNLTIRGDNTTLVMDRTMNLWNYININESENITVEGFNMKTAQSIYTLSQVDGYSLSGKPYIDVTTEHSLGITESYDPTLDDCYMLPYTDHKNRCHIYIDYIDVLDAAAQKYRIYVAAEYIGGDNYQEKIPYMVENNLPLLLPIPEWGRCNKDDGSGSFIVTNTTDLTMKDLNMWASPGGSAFHMRNNYGEFHVQRVNLTTEPGSEGLLAGWADTFHLKENRCRFVIEDCTLEKSGDDIFNFSVTHCEVAEVYSETEFNMVCPEFEGVYNLPLQVGDVLTLITEETGMFVGRTKIKEIVKQGSGTQHVIVEDPLPYIGYGTDVYVDSAGQPNSIIRNCKITGTYRFRTPILVEDCELNTLYGFIDTVAGCEGPVPRNITFKNCVFKSIKSDNLKMNYIHPTCMMQIGAHSIESQAVGTAPTREYYAENIVFEDCDIDPELIHTMDGTAEISFIKDGKEYLSIKPGN